MTGSPLPKDPLQVTALLGNARSDRHDAVHALEHEGRVEVIDIARADAARKRLRARTDKVREVQIALPRDQSLEDGAVLVSGLRANSSTVWFSLNATRGGSLAVHSTITDLACQSDVRRAIASGLLGSGLRFPKIPSRPSCADRRPSPR